VYYNLQTVSKPNATQTQPKRNPFATQKKPKKGIYNPNATRLQPTATQVNTVFFYY